MAVETSEAWQVAGQAIWGGDRSGHRHRLQWRHTWGWQELLLLHVLVDVQLLVGSSAGVERSKPIMLPLGLQFPVPGQLAEPIFLVGLYEQ